MGWIANFWLILGHYLIGKKTIWCFPCLVIGNAIWVYLGIERGQLDTMFLSAVFIGISIYNFFAWKKLT